MFGISGVDHALGKRHRLAAETADLFETGDAGGDLFGRDPADLVGIRPMLHEIGDQLVEFTGGSGGFNARFHINLHFEQADLFERLNARSEEHTSELPSLMRISYAVFCLKKKKN